MTERSHNLRLVGGGKINMMSSCSSEFNTAIIGLEVVVVAIYAVDCTAVYTLKTVLQLLSVVYHFPICVGYCIYIELCANIFI